MTANRVVAWRVAVLLFGAAIAWPGALAALAQTELDRIVARVDNRIITQSDVRQARALRLVSDIGSDDAARRALENRLLMLAEVARSAPLAPTTDAELAARRTEWEAGIGGGGAAASRLAADGMSVKALEAWLQDDLRIQAHLNRQFGGIPEPDRQRVIGEWTARLRQRAGLR
jgi:hypothetical protein